MLRCKKGCQQRLAVPSRCSLHRVKVRSEQLNEQLGTGLYAWVCACAFVWYTCVRFAQVPSALLQLRAGNTAEDLLSPFVSCHSPGNSPCSVLVTEQEILRRQLSTRYMNDGK